MKVTGTGIVSPLGRITAEIAKMILSAAPEQARPASDAPSFWLGPFNVWVLAANAR